MSELKFLDHDAIRKAYPNVTFINDTDLVIQDAEGKDVTVEQSKIDEARATLNAEFTATKYQKQRAEQYPPLEDFADAMYWNLMAITCTWEINGTQCKRDVADGYYTNVVYRVKGMDGTEEKARRTGEIVFTKPESLPSDFIAFDTSKKTPDESTMLTWVKDSLGSTEVAAIEASLKAEIDLINTPVQTTGVAF